MAKLTASDGEASDFFGTSVSISGDQAIVGAYGDADNGYRSGSAYIFEKTDGSWIQTEKLKPIDGQSFDYFGASGSITLNQVVIGAPSAFNTGSAYVFEKLDGSWIQTADHCISAGFIYPRTAAGIVIAGVIAVFIAGGTAA